MSSGPFKVLKSHFPGRAVLNFPHRCFLSLCPHPHSNNVSIIFQPNKKLSTEMVQCIKNINAAPCFLHSLWAVIMLCLITAAPSSETQTCFSYAASIAFDPQMFDCQLDWIHACHQIGKTSSWHRQLIVEEMSQHVLRHILDTEQTLDSEGEKLVMRGELRVPLPLLTLAVHQEPRYLSFLLRVCLVILKSCLLSHYF